MKIKKSILREGYDFTYDKAYGSRRKSPLVKRLEGIEEPLRERKNIKRLTDEANKDEKEILRIALEKSIKSGAYSKFVAFHSQFMFDIHSFRQANQRFLPWHRVYLTKFEDMLNDEMRKEEPNKDYNISFPYWDWEHDREIPEIFKDFKPSMDVEVYFYDDNGNLAGSEIHKNLQVKRFPHPDLSNELPRESMVNQIRELPTFVEFTNALEEIPHNSVHGLVGGDNPAPDRTKPFDESGAMSNPYISPLDPLFWCHHGNIDRIWAGWQKIQRDSGNIEYINPQNLTIEEQRMHPWYPEFMEEQTREIESMGYKYDSM